MLRLGPRRTRSAHRLALSPVCWGIGEAHDWGHQIDPERVLSEAAAVGEGAITAGPPRFLPDRSDQARALLRRHRLQVVAGQVHAILHHHEIRGPELAHIDGHAHWLSAVGAETLVLAAIPERTPGATRPDQLSKAQWAHLLHLIGEDNIMVETDFPHFDSTWPQCQAMIRSEMPHLTAEQVHKACYQNAVRVYNHVPPPADWLARAEVVLPTPIAAH